MQQPSSREALFANPHPPLRTTIYQAAFAKQRFSISGHHTALSLKLHSSHFKHPTHSISIGADNLEYLSGFEAIGRYKS